MEAVALLSAAEDSAAAAGILNAFGVSGEAATGDMESPLSLRTLQAWAGSVLALPAAIRGLEAGATDGDDAEEEDEEEAAEREATALLEALGAAPSRGGGTGVPKRLPRLGGGEGAVQLYLRFERPTAEADSGRRRRGPGGGAAELLGVKVPLKRGTDVLALDLAPGEVDGVLLPGRDLLAAGGPSRRRRAARGGDAASGGGSTDADAGTAGAAAGGGVPVATAAKFIACDAPFELGDPRKVRLPRTLLCGEVAAVAEAERIGKELDPDAAGGFDSDGDDAGGSDDDDDDDDGGGGGDSSRRRRGRGRGRRGKPEASAASLSAVMDKLKGAVGLGTRVAEATGVSGCLAVPVAIGSYVDVGRRPWDAATAAWTLEMWTCLARRCEPDGRGGWSAQWDLVVEEDGRVAFRVLSGPLGAMAAAGSAQRDGVLAVVAEEASRTHSERRLRPGEWAHVAVCVDGRKAAASARKGRVGSGPGAAELVVNVFVGGEQAAAGNVPAGTALWAELQRGGGKPGKLPGADVSGGLLFFAPPSLASLAPPEAARPGAAGNGGGGPKRPSPSQAVALSELRLWCAPRGAAAVAEAMDFHLDMAEVKKKRVKLTFRSMEDDNSAFIDPDAGSGGPSGPQGPLRSPFSLVSNLLSDLGLSQGQKLALVLAAWVVTFLYVWWRKQAEQAKPQRRDAKRE
ncbi:hypothetical protein FNF31_00712 [Cafeteria roenbergensis]|uniref:Uncharacterized protein n=1 Tax=Cafeteria roenbergensis TaxID=33653 RepID=A0A5A8DT14_CAFRO|nr:hypothetical protein FNF31_00712 [Cafeteria roenbergensis]KAA0171680.1 hypothetical protein FNF28_00613 [Cafeteria roenbergensis]